MVARKIRHQTPIVTLLSYTSEPIKRNTRTTQK